MNVKAWKWRRKLKKKSDRYILNNVSALLQDGKSEPVPSRYLPDANFTQDNFLELFPWLYFDVRISEL